MKITEAYKLAAKCMKEHGVDDYKLVFNDTKTICGQCLTYPKRNNLGRRGEIFISRTYCVNNGDAEVKDTILHEIAHALRDNSGIPATYTDGKEDCHDKHWRAFAIKLGANPKACAESHVYIPRRWLITCDGCGKSFEREKMPNLKGKCCAKCREGQFKVKFNPSYKKEGGLLKRKVLT